MKFDTKVLVTLKDGSQCVTTAAVLKTYLSVITTAANIVKWEVIEDN